MGPIFVKGSFIVRCHGEIAICIMRNFKLPPPQLPAFFFTSPLVVFFCQGGGGEVGSCPPPRPKILLIDTFFFYMEGSVVIPPPNPPQSVGAILTLSVFLYTPSPPPRSGRGRKVLQGLFFAKGARGRSASPPATRDRLGSLEGRKVEYKAR